MTDLDLALRRPGQVLLLERGAASALLERTLAHQRPGRGLLGGALAALGLGADRGEIREERPRVLGLPSLRWTEPDDYGDGYAIVDGVAIFDVQGVLTPEGYYDWWEDRWAGGYAQIGETYAAAQDDERVRAVLGRVNSPGGLVDGCFDLAEDLRARNGANGGKPFWVHASMACSAAYALASSADRILAPREGDVGSIGVVVIHMEMAEWLAEIGIKVEAIQSAPRKTDAAGWKPLSEDARAHLQSVVDQVARRFVAVVEAGRGLSADDIQATEARWFLAEHDDPVMSGLALGLVDEIANERAAFAALVSSLELSGAPAAGAASIQTEETTMSLQDEIAALRARAAKGDAGAKKRLRALNIPIKAAADDEEAETEDEDTEAEREEEDAEGEDKDKAKKGKKGKAAEDDEEAEDDPEDPEAESGDDEEEAEDDEDREPSARAVGTKAGFALLNCKAARGRDGLARQLAAKVANKKLTYGEAKKMLGAAPRGSRLGSAMDGRDRNPGASHGGAKSGQGLAAAVDRLNSKRKR
ncbi:S49 family peptidase [Pelagibacterium montanilacus]|uniref:S49 family peptidase n=1 Tax=Pelagibacterium montanilacus TaxID=2185280 RepID=UPI000F8D658D|nr:S49 family peptidase [Pelagibacterium montanilacus]